MNGIVFLIICLTIQFINASNSVELECSYETVQYGKTFFYRCENQNILNIVTKTRTLIESHIGDHNDNMTDDKVEGFFSFAKNIQYFPQGLNKIFKNLKRIMIDSNNLKELNQADLKSYEKLDVLMLDNNLIEVLHDGIFQYNPDLVWISLENNFLIQIYPRVFDGLTKLDILNLKSNFCINKKANYNSKALQNLILEVRIQCSNAEFIEIDEEVRELEENMFNLNSNNVVSLNVDYHKLYLKLDNSVITESVYLNLRLQKFKNYLDVAMAEFYQNLFKKVENLEKRIQN